MALLRGKLLAGALFAGALFANPEVVEAEQSGGGGKVVEKVLPSQELGHTITTGRRTKTTAVKHDWAGVASSLDAKADPSASEAVSLAPSASPEESKAAAERDSVLAKSALDQHKEQLLQAAAAQAARTAVELAAKQAEEIALNEKRRAEEEALLMIIMESL